MEEQLISFKTAKLAKDKGFNIEVFNWFYLKENRFIDQLPIEWKSSEKLNFNLDFNNKLENQVSRPTQSLLQKWLREKHNIHVNPDIYHIWYYTFKNIEPVYRCKIIFFVNRKKQSTWIGLGKYEDVLELGLQKALTLINYEKTIS